MRHAGREGLMGLSDARGTPVTEWSATAGLSAYRDGVTVICELAAQFSARAWRAATPCAELRATHPRGALPHGGVELQQGLHAATSSRAGPAAGAGHRMRRSVAGPAAGLRPLTGLAGPTRPAMMC